MAKILVADDNSNIQKMVGLALKDQGIDVVAVGNGEAAVRKISDVKPDLVLADVFMPVRNGYEVCKYVKDDAALAHIPVILLVGAFDPLDEQEAQRVGADGVLKKPFVPPEPLISMVKSALSRAGVLHSDRHAEPAPIQAADMIVPRIPEIPTVDSVSAYGGSASDNSADFVRRQPPEPVRIDSGAPLAFGNLLETPVVKEEEEDPGYVPSTPSNLALERDWRSSEETEEEEVEEEPNSAWRRDNEAFEGSAASNTARDWRDTPFADLPTRRSAREAWEPTHEKTALVEAAGDEVMVATTETLPAPTPISGNKTAAAPFAGDAWAAAIAAGSEERAASPEAVASEPAVVSELAPAPVVENNPALESEPVHEAASSAAETVAEKKAKQEVPSSEAVKSSAAESWFSPAPSPWDAEVKKAGELAAGWDSQSVVSAPAPDGRALEVATSAWAAPVESFGEAVAQEAGLPTSAVEAIREEAALATENVPVTASVSETASPSVTPETNMDDLVAKVLARISPEVLQAVTREILKPVVEAMVRDELNSRKS